MSKVHVANDFEVMELKSLNVEGLGTKPLSAIFAMEFLVTKRGARGLIYGGHNYQPMRKRRHDILFGDAQEQEL